MGATGVSRGGGRAGVGGGGVRLLQTRRDGAEEGAPGHWSPGIRHLGRERRSSRSPSTVEMFRTAFPIVFEGGCYARRGGGLGEDPWALKRVVCTPGVGIAAGNAIYGTV